MTKKELSYFTKNELIEAIVAVSKYDIELERYLSRIKAKKQQQQRDDLYKASIEADNEWEKALKRYNNFVNDMLNKYNVPNDNGTFKYSDLFEVVPSDVISEYSKEIERYNKAVDKMNKATDDFIKG